MAGILAKLPTIFNDHLYRNSMFLVLSRLLNVTAGFLFWVIAAKLYAVTEVGNATALISILGLIMLLSRFGFDLSLIRYVANADLGKVFNTSLIITTGGAVFFSLTYILLLIFMQNNVDQDLVYWIVFVLIALFNSITLVSGNMLLALRKGQYFFIQTILISFRLLLLFPLANLKSFGILFALGICYVLTALFSLWALHQEVKINFLQVDIAFVKESFRYSIGSYFSNMLIEAPNLILPIMVLYLIGPEDAAKYYIAMAIGNLALIVPYALSFSLFVEGSNGQPLKNNIIKACSTAYLFLIPIIVIIGLLGKNILALICIEYVEAYKLLLLVTFTSLFTVIYSMYISVLNIQMRVEWNVKFNLLRFLLLIGASFYLTPKYGINGVGYAWLITHVILTFIIGVQLVNTRVIKAFWGKEDMEFDKSEKIPILTFTTGAVIRDLSAKNLVVLIFNTTCNNLEVRIVVNDLTQGRKPDSVNILLIKGNFTKSLTLPKPPILYEVLVEGISPGVYLWTSTSSNECGPYLQANKFIESNTYRHNDFILVTKYQ